MEPLRLVVSCYFYIDSAWRAIGIGYICENYKRQIERFIDLYQSMFYSRAPQQAVGAQTGI